MGEEIKYFNRGWPEQEFSGLRLVDCHAHLEELEEPEAARERAGRSGVRSIVTVGSDLESNRRVLSLSGCHGEVTVHAALGKDLSKPVIIHARGAWEECLRLVSEEQISKTVFHWFSGPMEMLRELLHHGYLISATPAPHYSEKHQSAIREAPLERILLETDSPVLYEGRRSEPADVVRTLQAVARIKQIPEPEVANVTTTNAVRFFGLGGPGLGPSQ